MSRFYLCHLISPQIMKLAVAHESIVLKKGTKEVEHQGADFFREQWSRKHTVELAFLGFSYDSSADEGNWNIPQPDNQVLQFTEIFERTKTFVSEILGLIKRLTSRRDEIVEYVTRDEGSPNWLADFIYSTNKYALHICQNGELQSDLDIQEAQKILDLLDNFRHWATTDKVFRFTLAGMFDTWLVVAHSLIMP